MHWHPNSTFRYRFCSIFCFWYLYNTVSMRFTNNRSLRSSAQSLLQIQRLQSVYSAIFWVLTLRLTSCLWVQIFGLKTCLTLCANFPTVDSLRYSTLLIFLLSMQIFLSKSVQVRWTHRFLYPRLQFSIFTRLIPTSGCLNFFLPTPSSLLTIFYTLILRPLSSSQTATCAGAGGSVISWLLVHTGALASYRRDWFKEWLVTTVIWNSNVFKLCLNQGKSDVGPRTGWLA